MTQSWDAPPEMQIDSDKNYSCTLETSKGAIDLDLYPEHAPKTVNNFVFLARAGFYDGISFHRVIPNFMVQGGGMTSDMTRKKTRPAIRNEADNGLKNDRSTVAMARTAAKDSATSQFFVNVKDNVFLNHGSRDFGYAVFGRVLDGMDVADAIAVVPTRTQDLPVETVSILTVRRQ